MVRGVLELFLFAGMINLVECALFTSNVDDQESLWRSFKLKFQKVYSSDVEDRARFSRFLENLRLADIRNELEQSANGTATHGMTRFSDLSLEEFASTYLIVGAISESRFKNAAKLSIKEGPKANLGLVDWTPTLTTPIKNQGYCGSCWAFSVTEQLESDAMRMLSKSYVLSAEQIIQCDTASHGCNGGLPENGYNYVKKIGGIEQESDYPYSSENGVTGKCTADKNLFVVGVESYTVLNDEPSMGAYVQSYGTLSACIDATTWTTYTGGVMSACGQSVNHCVQIVGVDASDAGFWKVRNSWGTSWGEDGYIRLAYGKNICAISSDAAYATVFSV